MHCAVCTPVNGTRLGAVSCYRRPFRIIVRRNGIVNSARRRRVFFPSAPSSTYSASFCGPTVTANLRFVVRFVNLAATISDSNTSSRSTIRFYIRRFAGDVHSGLKFCRAIRYNTQYYKQERKKRRRYRSDPLQVKYHVM